MTLVSRRGENSTDHITPEQKQGSELSGRLGYPCSATGWDGGYGTSWYSDPREGFTGILLTQRMMDLPQPPRVMADFWTSAYQAIDD